MRYPTLRSNAPVFMKGGSTPLDVLYGPFHIHGQGRTCDPQFVLVKNPETARIVAVPRSLLDQIVA